MQLSGLSRDVSLCHGCRLAQTLTDDQSIQPVSRVLASKRNVCINPLDSGGGHKKTLRVGVGEGQREGVFWPCQGCCTPQLTAFTVAYTRLAHDHACQHFSMEWEQTHEPLPGTEELHMDK